MATWGELLERLSNSEKEKFLAERQAEAQVRQAEARVTAMTQRVAELKREQEQAKRELRTQCEKQLRDVAARARREALMAEQEKVNEEGCAEAAQIDMLQAERHVLDLTQKVADLQAMFAAAKEVTSERIERTEREADARIERVSAQANQRINDMSQLAKEVQEAAATCIDQMVSEHAEQVSRADMRAEGRVRFKELCTLSAMRSDLEISQKEYEDAKDDLLNLWRKQWQVFNNPQNSGGDPLSPRFNPEGDVFGKTKPPVSPRDLKPPNSMFD